MVRKSTIWFTVFLRVLRNQIFVGDRFDEAFGKHLLGIAGMALSTLVTVVGFEEVSIFFSEARKHGVLRTVKWYGSEATALSPLIGNVLAAVVQSSKKKTKNAHGAEQPKQNQLKDETAATMLQRYGISPKQAALAEKIGINVKVVCTDIRTPMAKAAQHGTMLQTIAGQALPSPSSTLALIGWAGQGPPNPLQGLSGGTILEIIRTGMQPLKGLGEFEKSWRLLQTKHEKPRHARQDLMIYLRDGDGEIEKNIKEESTND